MIGTLFLLAIGMGLLLLLFLLSPSVPAAAGALEEEERGSENLLIALDLEPPSQALINRIVAQEDWEFIDREGPSLRSIFLEERRRLTLLWLRETSAYMAKLFRLYRLVARSTESLSLAMEIKTITNYAFFHLLAGAAWCWIYILGPFHARAAIAKVFVTVDLVFSGLGRTVADLGPAAWATIETEWARQSRTAD